MVFECGFETVGNATLILHDGGPIPFSAMHRFQRTDSAWANRHSPRPEDYAEGFDASARELLPAYLRYVEVPRASLME